MNARRAAILVGWLVVLASPVLGQTAGMLSFQGLFKDAVGNPVNGTVDLEFRIFDEKVAGNLVDMDGDGVVEDVCGEDVTCVSTVTVTDGILSTKFGPVLPGAFGGSQRWLELSVDDGGGAGFVALSRVEMATAPAVSEQVNIPSTGIPAIEVDGTGNVTIPGTIQAGSSITINGAADTITASSGTIAFDDENLTAAGLVESTVAGFKFPDATIQTTAAVPGGDTLGGLGCADGEIAKWNNTTALWECAADDTGGGGSSTLDEAYDGSGAGAGRTIVADAGAVNIQGPGGLTVLGTITAGSSITIDGTEGSERITSTEALELHVSSGRALRLETHGASPNIIGGHPNNSANDAAGESVIGGTVAGGGATGSPNSVTANFATVGGGVGTVGGGSENLASGIGATVGGGRDNTASGENSTVCGGGGFFDGSLGNTASGLNSTACGGALNTAGGDYSFAAGSDSTASGFNSTACGGLLNTAGGDFSFAAGRGNTASGFSSTACGGFVNTAGGDFSFAAGRGATVRDAAAVTADGKVVDVDGDEGTFVWSDTTLFPSVFKSTGPNQFLINASGGVAIGTNDPAGSVLRVAGPSGDLSVALPTDAISASEMFNEPGVAGNGTVTSAVLVGGIQTIASQTITVPTSGFVLAMGTAQVEMMHINGTQDKSIWGVNSIAGAFLANHILQVSVPPFLPGASYDQNVTVQALFAVSAGANTFFLLAQRTFGSVVAKDIQLTLLFFPTSYGTVTGAAGAGEAHARNEEAFRVSGAELSDGLSESPEPRGGDAVGGERELSGLLARMEARIASLEQQWARLSPTQREED